MCSCPTTVSKVCGLYFLAETMNFSINLLQDRGIVTWRNTKIIHLFSSEIDFLRKNRVTFKLSCSVKQIAVCCKFPALVNITDCLRYI